MKNQVIIVIIVVLFALTGLSLTSQTGFVTFESRVFENFLYNIKTAPLIVVSTNFSITEMEYSELLQNIVYKRMSTDLRPKTIFRVPIDLPTAKLEIGETIGSVMSSLSEQKMLHFGKPIRTNRLPFGALNKEGILLDTEAKEYTKYDKIVTGNPCKNSFMMEYLYDLSNCSLAFEKTPKFIRTFNEDGRRTVILGAKTDEEFKSLILEII